MRYSRQRVYQRRRFDTFDFEAYFIAERRLIVELSSFGIVPKISFGVPG